MPGCGQDAGGAAGQDRQQEGQTCDELRSKSLHVAFTAQDLPNQMFPQADPGTENPVGAGWGVKPLSDVVKAPCLRSEPGTAVLQLCSVGRKPLQQLFRSPPRYVHRTEGSGAAVALRDAFI